MSQWILIALFLLAHPLMMLFMHKGMHGGSGSMGGCGNNTQQNSNNTEKPRKKSQLTWGYILYENINW